MKIRLKPGECFVNRYDDSGNVVAIDIMWSGIPQPYPQPQPGTPPPSTPPGDIYPPTLPVAGKATPYISPPAILAFGDWESNNDKTQYINGWTYESAPQITVPIYPATATLWDDPTIAYPIGGTWGAVTGDPNHVIYDNGDYAGQHQVLQLIHNGTDVAIYNEVRAIFTCSTAIEMREGGEGSSYYLENNLWIPGPSTTVNGFIYVSGGGTPGVRWSIDSIELRFNPNI